MKMLSWKRETAGPGLPGGNGINSHTWATKMEIQRSLSGKPDLRIHAISRTTVQRPEQTGPAKQ
jgi:hypothetical protein